MTQPDDATAPRIRALLRRSASQALHWLSAATRRYFVAGVVFFPPPPA